MDTEFITYYNPTSTQLTSNLTSIKARTNKAKVEAKLVRDPNGDNEEFFSTSIYAFDNIVELIDVGLIIEDFFRSKDFQQQAISCIIDGVNMTFNALYCEAIVNSDFNPKAGFYSCAASQIVHRNSVISLAHWNHGHRRYRVQVVGIGQDGEIAAIEREFTRTATSKWVTFAVSEILNWALNQAESETINAISKVSYFAISHENAQKIFYLVDDPFYLTFSFRNVFNVTEYLDVVGTLKQKTKVDSGITVCSGIALQYDRKSERTFEITTGPLSVDEARAVEALIMSRNIELFGSCEDYPILITDNSIERDNDDSSLCSIKFTFRFASDRVVLTEDEIRAISPSRSKIFSHEFTAEFA